MIAISYRRQDSLPIAGRLYDRLENKFGAENVFMDFDSIPAGSDFRQQIKETIERSHVVIALIGSNWTGQRSGELRRIDDPTDFVRLEIQYALRSGIPIIPVLIDNTLMPNSENLPSDIQEIAFRHALPLDSGLDFRQHVERLIASISELVGTNQRPRVPYEARSDKAGSSRRTRRIIGAFICLIIGGIFAGWFLKNSRYTEQPRSVQLSTPAPTVPAASPIASPSVTQLPAVAEPTPENRAEPKIRAAKEIGKSTKYRVTTATSDEPMTTVWILRQPTDELVATLNVGFLSANNALFSKDNRYLTLTVGGASAGTRIRLYRLAEDGKAEEINLKLTPEAPGELLKKVMQLPEDAGFAHEYQTPTGILSDPLVINFELYVDYYMNAGKQVKIGKPTKFEYRVETDALLIVGILPAVSNQKQTSSLSGSNTIDQTFVGVWEGTYDQRQSVSDGDKHVATMTGRLTLSRTGEALWEIIGSPPLAFDKEQWMQSNLMTICSRPPRPNVAYSGWNSSLTLNSDGKSAVYIATSETGSANRGIFYKRSSASQAQMTPQSESSPVEKPSTAVASKKLFAGTWKGVVHSYFKGKRQGDQYVSGIKIPGDISQTWTINEHEDTAQVDLGGGNSYNETLVRTSPRVLSNKRWPPTTLTASEDGKTLRYAEQHPDGASWSGTFYKAR